MKKITLILIIGIFLMGVVVGVGLDILNPAKFEKESDAVAYYNTYKASYESDKQNFINSEMTNAEVSDTICEIDFESGERECYVMFSYELDGQEILKDAPINDTQEYMEKFFSGLYESYNPPEVITYKKEVAK